jgi:hypothetical protein
MLNAVVTTENASLDTGPVQKTLRGVFKKPVGMIYVLISLLLNRAVITLVAFALTFTRSKECPSRKFGLALSQSRHLAKFIRPNRIDKTLMRRRGEQMATRVSDIMGEEGGSLLFLFPGCGFGGSFFVGC